MPRAQIKTGQYVSIAQTPASVGERIVAQIIDWILLSFYMWGVLFALIWITDAFSIYILDRYIRGLVVIFALLPSILYFPLCEVLLNGQSLGKRVMKLQVTMLDGSSPTLGAYVMRWVLYPIDTFLTSGLGAVFILFTDNNQRIGDLAAGTVVIKKEDYSHNSFILNDAPYVAPGYEPTYPEAASLSLNQVDLISRTFYTNSPNRDQLIERLASKIQQHLGIERMGMNAADFITTVSNDYHYYAATLDI